MLDQFNVVLALHRPVWRTLRSQDILSGTEIPGHIIGDRNPRTCQEPRSQDTWQGQRYQDILTAERDPRTYWQQREIPGNKDWDRDTKTYWRQRELPGILTGTGMPGLRCGRRRLCLTLRCQNYVGLNVLRCRADRKRERCTVNPPLRYLPSPPPPSFNCNLSLSVPCT